MIRQWTLILEPLYFLGVELVIFPFSYEDYSEDVYGCTDPNSSNYDPDATEDDGSCECPGAVLEMTMYDSYGDGWNGVWDHGRIWLDHCFWHNACSWCRRK